jgi:hypothetical protein
MVRSVTTSAKSAQAELTEGVGRRIRRSGLVAESSQKSGDHVSDDWFVIDHQGQRREVFYQEETSWTAGVLYLASGNSDPESGSIGAHAHRLIRFPAHFKNRLYRTVAVFRVYEVERIATNHGIAGGIPK